MKKARLRRRRSSAFSKDADAGTPVKEICRTHRVSDATDDNWKSKYGGMSASDLKRLKEMARELSQPGRMYADMAMGNRALRDLIGKKLQGRQRTRSSDLIRGPSTGFLQG